MRSTLLFAAVASALVCALGFAATARAAEPPPPWSVDITVRPGAVVGDCSGAALTTAQLQALATTGVYCIRFTTAAGNALELSASPPAPRATVAGIAGGTRAVYAATATKTRGKKLGDLTVGTVAQPLGYACDPSDTVSTTYARITDPNVGGVFAGGYVTGCGK